MYKFLALAAAVGLALVWHSKIAGLVLFATVIAVFLTIMIQSTAEARR